MTTSRKRRRGFLATREGLAILEERRLAKGYTYDSIVEAAGLNADDQVKKLFNPHWGKGVQKDAIEKIAAVLELQPTEFIEDWLPKPTSSKQKQTEMDASVIDWQEVCSAMLEQQQQEQRIRRKATEQGFETKVFVPLGLLERKQQQRRSGNVSLEQVHQLEQEVISRIYEHNDFLKDVIAQKPTGNNKHIAIIGEPGAGKTTLLDAIASYIKENTQNLPICISLASLQGKTVKDYILKEWLPEAVSLVYPDIDIDVETQYAASLQKRLRQGDVWLLLDGVDEMGIGLPLQEIRSQFTDWLGRVRVILTCRTNVWDANLNNPLTGFDTYKTQEFKPEQVDLFIQQWFAEAKDSQRGQELQVKLKEPQRARILQLVTNPLRLSLLCQIFNKDKQAELPETKAALYKQFVSYFYEWKPSISGIDWATQPELQEKLHQALGRLSLVGLDSSARFRLPLSLVQKEVDSNLFKLAWEIGWLNLVDREMATDEPVYAFLHPTFQEYFASLAICQCNYFLNYDSKTSCENSYKIFENVWKEPFLFWIGRDNVCIDDKEKLLRALITFNENFNCEKFYYYRAYFIAAEASNEFPNSLLICTIVKQVVEWSSLKFSDNIYELERFLVQEEAAKKLQYINRQEVVHNLVKLLHPDEDEQTRWLASINLLKLDPSNQNALKTLLSQVCNFKISIVEMYDYLIEYISDKNISLIPELEEMLAPIYEEKIRLYIASILLKIRCNHEKAINTIVDILRESKNFFLNIGISEKFNDEKQSTLQTFSLGIELVGEVGIGNKKAINCLSELLFSTTNDCLRWKIATNLLKIDSCNEEATNILVSILINNQNKKWLAVTALFGVELSEVFLGNFKIIQALEQLLINYSEYYFKFNKCSYQETSLISNTEENLYLWAAITLIKIDSNNINASNALNKILNYSQKQEVWIEAATALGKNESFKFNVIKYLVELLLKNNISLNKNAARSIAKINPGNSEAVTFLSNVLKTSQDRCSRLEAAECLDELLQGQLPPLVVSALKDCLADDFNNSGTAYEIIWHCAQQINYVDFYKAWHTHPFTYHPEALDNISVSSSYTTQHLNFHQLKTSLHLGFINDSTLNQALKLVCIDGSQFSDRHNPAADIYIEMVEQGCPERLEGTPTSMQLLKTYWRLDLRKLEKRVALVFYNSKTDCEFSESCLDALSTFGGAIAVITNQSCENVECISPNHPDLSDAILKWLRRVILES